MKDVVEKHPNMHGIRPWMATFLSAQGKHDEAIAQLSPEVKRNGEVDADISYSIGSVYALEGLANDAFEWLERSIALGMVKGGRARVGETLHVPMPHETIAVNVAPSQLFDPAGVRLNG